MRVPWALASMLIELMLSRLVRASSAAATAATAAARYARSVDAGARTGSGRRSAIAGCASRRRDGCSLSWCSSGGSSCNCSSLSRRSSYCSSCDGNSQRWVSGHCSANNGSGSFWVSANQASDGSHQRLAFCCSYHLSLLSGQCDACGLQSSQGGFICKSGT